MYLTFSRSGELLSGSDEVWYKSNLASNEFGFHYFDKYVVVQNRPEIDFLEEQYNEDMGVSELVVGQYELSEEMKLFLDLYEKREDTIKKAKERVSLEVEKSKELRKCRTLCSWAVIVHF